MGNSLDDIHTYIPVDKSWGIRMMMRSMMDGCPEFGLHLLDHGPLPDDLQYAVTAAAQIDLAEAVVADDGWISVGGSATLYRFLCYARAKYALPLQFTYIKQLHHRTNGQPEITSAMVENYTYADWLTFHATGFTSQFASAAIIFGDVTETQVMEYHEATQTPIPDKVLLSLRCVKKWNEARRAHTFPSVWKDRTLLGQAFHFANVQKNCVSYWRPRTAEDYCTGVAWGMLDVHEGADQHPSVRHHESNREAAMAQAMRIAESLEPGEFPIFTDDDHRVITSMALAFCLSPDYFDHANVVSKAWPRFWDFYNTYNKHNRGI